MTEDNSEMKKLKRQIATLKAQNKPDIWEFILAPLFLPFVLFDFIFNFEREMKGKIKTIANGYDKKTPSKSPWNMTEAKQD